MCGLMRVLTIVNVEYDIGHIYYDFMRTRYVTCFASVYIRSRTILD